ncbi:MAG: DUF58 domain-containing protein [Planctomycetes bacterium]|nr:DUF58 domain-containing protein [Planctomycetota bacterium]
MRINSLELRAKLVVEGFWNGLNRSPYHGFSVEFTEYRQYSPGDDPRYLDWKLFARSDRYYIKRFEDETNLRCHLLLDLSRSMEYGSLSYTKLDYARTLAATLAYFLSTQRDAVGLVTFHEQIEETIPARYRVGHLRRLLVALERQVGGAETDLIQPLEQIAERVSKRGMLILISDLLAPVDQFETNLGYLRARGHEVLLFHIIDPAELSFEFDQPMLFEDAESRREIYVDPSKAREGYLRKLEAHLAGVRASCERLGITYRQFSTDTPLESALSEFLRSRLHKTGRPVGHRRNQGRRTI